MARLDEICSLNMGQSPDSSSYNEIGDGLPFFQGNADFGVLHPNVRIWCNAPTKIAHPGDILISVRAPIGALNIADRECCIGRGLAALTVDETLCNSGYLWYAIANKVDELNAKGTGSTFKAISKNVLGETEVALPSLDRQQRIASTLDKLSNLISLRKQQLAKLDELVKARFVEMFGAETDFEKWPCCTIGEVADVCVGVVIKPTQYYTSKGVPAFRSLNIGEMQVNDNNWVFFTEEGHQKNQKSIIRKDDVLVVRSGAPGIACVATEKYNGYNAVDIIIAHPDNAKINSIFLAMFTNLPHGMNQIKGKTGGAAQQHFNVSGYKSLKLILPPLNCQNEFASFVEQTSRQKLTIQQSLDKLEVLKKSLMQEYFG